VGYNHGKTFFDGMLRGKQSLIPSAGNNGQFLQRVGSTRSLSSLDRPLSGAYNFTDLAQLVCKVRGNVPVQVDRDSEDDYSDDDQDDNQETGYNSEPPLEFLRPEEDLKCFDDLDDKVRGPGKGDLRQKAVLETPVSTSSP